MSSSQAKKQIAKNILKTKKLHFGYFSSQNSLGQAEKEWE